MSAIATATATHTAIPAIVTPLRVLPPAKDIPLTFTAGIKSWWEVGTSASGYAEERLLRKLEYYRSTPPRSFSEVADQPVVAYSSKVALDGKERFINTLSITSTSPCNSAPPPAVLLHGYGAGLGFFFKNFGVLGEWAAARQSSVYAIDWLGMGRSARVPFVVHAKRNDIPGRVREAEAFFVDSLEEWREKMNLEKMTLVGHSLGAYMSVAYALKYPTRVSKLVLLSPAGVPRDPYAVSSREVADDQSSETYISVDDPKRPMKPKVEEIKAEQRNQGRRQGRLWKLFTYLWEEGWSPFQVVRSAMWYGPILVGKYSARRFHGFSDDEVREMHDYILNITLAKGSGEYCISHILAPGAHARMPLVDRIAALEIPVTFAYGDTDWMDPEGGAQAIENLVAAGNTHSKLYTVKNAGHHLYLDNADAVNKLLVKELDRAPR